jgi:hypothetical protein
LFGKLPEIFGRDFAVGYFLPSAVFAAASIKLTGLEIPIRTGLGQDIFENAVLFGLVSWFGGIILLAINRNLIRAMEGYGRFNPAQLLKWIEVRRFVRLTAAISLLNRQRDACKANGQEVSSELQDQRIRLTRLAAERFPDQVAWVLPTAFGNTIRAFEVYPRVIYGVDSIYGWNRLVAVIPKEYREQVEAAKAQMDFWVNLSFLSALIVLEYGGVYAKRPTISPWIVVAALSAATVSYKMARNAAGAWGDLIKAAFDVFLPELRKRLEFGFPVDKNEEQAIWTGFSQTIIYRLRGTMPDRVEQPKEK